MAIKFKAIERGEPGVEGGGSKKWYALNISSGERNIDQLTKAIEKISTVSGADIRAVLYALVDVCVDDLDDGYIIRLGDLGNLRVNLSSNGVDTEEEVNNSIIKGSKIVFKPGTRLKKMLDTLEYKKVVE